MLLSPWVVASLVRQTTKTDFDIFFAGSLAGTSHCERTASHLNSSTTLKLQGFDIVSNMETFYEGGKPTGMNFKETMSQGGKVLRQGKVVVVNGKASVESAGKTQENVPVTLSSPMFTNFHPGLLFDFGQFVKWSEKSQEVSAFLVEGLSKLNIPMSIGEPKKVKLNDGTITVRLVDSSLGPVKLQFAFTDSGEYLGMDIPSQKLREIKHGYDAVFADVLSAYPELSQPTFETARSEVNVPMRDGVVTRASLIRPSKPGKYPVILERTPYNRLMATDDAGMYARRGYAVVVQDVRGTGESKGSFDPMVAERKDGYDTIDWISKQEWCDGNVGMIGASYVGFVQWAAAVEHHPALKCIVPQVSPPSSAMWNIPYENGVFTLLSDLWWLRIVDNPKGQNMLEAMGDITNLKGLQTLPLEQADDKLLGFNSKIFSEWLRRDTASKWPSWNFDEEMKGVTIPALHISGWYDGDEIGTQRNWQLVNGGGNKNQWLIYGPWTHFFNSSSKVGKVDFGKDAVLELDSLYIRWFDTWLKGKSVGLDQVPKVRFFAMGENKWHTSTAWPPAEAKQEILKMEFGDVNAGPKSTAKLLPSITKDTVARASYDPKQEKISTDSLKVNDSEADLYVKSSSLTKGQMVLRSQPFDRDRIVTGPVTVEFDFKSTAHDTDFFASAFDEDESKRMFIVFRPGKLKASYLQGLDQQRFLKPGQTYHAKLLLWDGASMFRKGHRLTVLITNSLFPGTARNLGSTEPIISGTKMEIQNNVIFSGPKNPGMVKFYAIN